VIASDPVAMRRDKAQSLGAEWVRRSAEQTDLAAFVQEVTDGWGVDAIALTVGSARMVEEVVR
jgi:threonine dehydrogenase-like Zn-dependent dehydrogenase